MHDVAIIGGGLAGLALSIELSRKGYDVVLIEKHRYPFHKVCGEYISRESEAYLSWLGADLDELGARRIKDFRLTHFKNSEVIAPLPLGGIGISRFTLDAALAEAAKRTGVTLLDGTRVTGIEGSEVRTNSDTVLARYIIGTHGKRSNIDKALNRPFIAQKANGRDHFIGVKYHVKADLPKDLIELHLFPDGYAGISAVEGDRYCLCYLTKAHHLETHGSIESMEKAVLHKNTYLQDYLQRFESFYDRPEAIAQINFQNKEKQSDGVFFAGDAAGLIAPLSGNGMSMALYSAHLLSKTLDLMLQGKCTEGEALKRYQADWDNAFQHRFRSARILQEVFFRPQAMHWLMKIANFFPPLKHRIIKQTHGESFFEE
jgi:flavin-dependent dehydrogenase